jgi:hypothetical protein
MTIPRRHAPASPQPQTRVAATAFLAATVFLAGCTGSAGTGHQPTAPSQRTAHGASSTASATPSPSPSPSALAALPVAPGAGLLRQTMARPSASDQEFRAMITDLWLAVSTGRPLLARPAFFPVDAYKQVKAIYDPAADWRSRLWLEFALDVKAAHRLLGGHPGTAMFVRAIVPSSAAAWVPPGACYNRVGYWHLANPRVVYRQHGQVRSFGIASLISWRGVWYVVHFGGVVRPADGMVDAPATGPGYPGPQGGC